MAKNAGELNTPVMFKKFTRTADNDGFPKEELENVFDVPMMCSWVNAHGQGAWLGMQLQLRDPAIITMRYSPKLMNNSLQIFKGGDDRPFEIISIDNIKERNEWIEMRIQRMESARDDG